MHYSFSTVLMTILASNLLIILITFCFRKEKLMLSIGYKLLAVFLILTLIRFLLPFEWTFTKTIFLPEFISKYIFYFLHPFIKNKFIKVSLWLIFEFIWLVGSLFCLYKHIRTRVRSARYIATFGRDITTQEPIQKILNGICKKCKNHIRVIQISNLDIPQIYGVFSPRILIPDFMKLNSEDLLFSLHHEAYHYFHHDLLIKEAVNLFCILYWWNPACRLFRRQVGLILEMHVDDSLVSNDSNVAKAYMRSLIHILESAVAKRNSISTNLTVAMASNEEKELTRRFQMLSRKQRKTHIPMFILLLMLVASIYLFFYGIILEANYTNVVDSDGITFDTLTGFHAVQKEDGTYDLYFNDIFTENLENLDYYPDIPVLPED